MEMLLADLKAHHADVAEKITGQLSWTPTIRPRTNCLPRLETSMPSLTGSSLATVIVTEAICDQE
jgi:hypothetical protein